MALSRLTVEIYAARELLTPLKGGPPGVEAVLTAAEAGALLALNDYLAAPASCHPFMSGGRLGARPFTRGALIAIKVSPVPLEW